MKVPGFGASEPCLPADAHGVPVLETPHEITALGLLSTSLVRVTVNLRVPDHYPKLEVVMRCIQ